MIPNRKYKFVKGVVLSPTTIFKAGHEFKTDRDGEMTDKDSQWVSKDILDIWLENEVIVDMETFVPKEGETFWYFHGTSSNPFSTTNSTTFSASMHKVNFVGRGNCFRSREDAEGAAKFLAKMLKGLYVNGA